MSTNENLHDYNYYHIKALKDRIKELENEIILDIGFNTIKKIQKKINESNTVLWNGPAGYFENKNFLKGTLSIAENISKNTIEKRQFKLYVGRMDSNEDSKFLKLFNQLDKMTLYKEDVIIKKKIVSK